LPFSTVIETCRGVPIETVDLRLDEMAGRELIGEQCIRQHGLVRDLVAASLTDFDVVRDRSDHLGQACDGDRARHLLSDGSDEDLLARVADEVVVRMPVADEIERVRPAQPLVAGPQVDVRIVRLERTHVVVVVAPVDVDPDASDSVDDLLEAAEIDRHQVVDRNPG
jgi:hypothetical protein